METIIHPSPTPFPISDDEFMETLQCSKEEFVKLPRWRQIQKKKTANLH